MRRNLQKSLLGECDFQGHCLKSKHYILTLPNKLMKRAHCLVKNLFRKKMDLFLMHSMIRKAVLRMSTNTRIFFSLLSYENDITTKELENNNKKRIVVSFEEGSNEENL